MSTVAVEQIKATSARLRGTLLASLADPVTGGLAEADQVLIKYHGSYQQDDRDVRDERRRQKLEPAYSFMLRTRTPGGVITPLQWLALDQVATQYADRGLRITTRQAFQLHGVIKSELKPTLQAINATLIDTLAACGDVNRNISVAAHDHAPQARAAVFAQAIALSETLLPKSRAYYEIWLDEEARDASGAEPEPILGPTYLPRKFKIGFAIPPFNDVDVFAQDLGFIAIVERDRLLGYNVSVGGGMGATHGDPETYPRLGDVIGFIAPERLTALAVAVVTAQRDHGNRVQRKRARLKYTLDDHGVDWFRREVEHRAGFALAAARPFEFATSGDRFGWQDAGRDRANLTLRIVAGRLADGEGAPHLSGLREIARALSALPESNDREGNAPEFRLTPNQNLVLARTPSHARAAIDALVREHALDLHATASPLGLDALACVAFPTCGLAMAEAERYLPRLIEQVESSLSRHGLADARIGLRISGCPNGCSRPYLGEIALVGKAPGRYNLMLGADHHGQRLNALVRENVDEAAILDALDPLFGRYRGEREAGEGFGDFLVRSGIVRVPAHVPIRVIA